MADAPVFTMEDAQTMINLVRAAPVQNMDAAEKVVRPLLDRFVAWATPILMPPAPAVPAAENLAPEVAARLDE